MATSVCRKVFPQCPASSEISWVESTGSAAAFGCKRVENIVSKGLVKPIVSTTIRSATPATFLRGVFITGESCEILSRPERASKANKDRDWRKSVAGKHSRNERYKG